MLEFLRILQERPSIKLSAYQKKPDPQRNFFQNYYDHLQLLCLDFLRAWKFIEPKPPTEKVNYLFEAMLKRLNMFEKLRDGHDYFDEVMGATVLPSWLLFAHLSLLVKALIVTIHHLMGKQQHEVDDKPYAAIAACCLILAIGSFLKSAISLVSRPIVTAVRGFEAQNKIRFYNESGAIFTENEASFNQSAATTSLLQK